MPEDHRWGLGQLGRRLLAAFLLVALSSVVVLTAAALFGTARGLSVSARESREAVAQAAATAAATAYQEAGGWDAAQLQQAKAIAAAAGFELVIQRPTSGSGAGTGPGNGGENGEGTGNGGGAGNGAGNGSGTGDGPGAGNGAGTGNGGTGNTPGPDPADTATGNPIVGPNAVTAPVIVEGTTVGLVRLVGPGVPAETTAQRVAWTWIIAAAAVAVAAATAMAWFVSRRLSAPLTDLTETARAFAAGDRDARASATSVAAPGELGELARSFNSTAEIVSNYEQTRRRMTADIAHEIRTPLTSLQAGLEEVRDGLVPADAEALDGLHAQSMRLGRIISDLSQLSDAESADLSLHRQRVDLAEVASEAVSSATPAITAAGLTVSVESTGSAFVSADPDRLHQALSNLLMNTVRHCRAGDHVTVRTAVIDQNATVEVADTGPGIPEPDLPHVFDRLWRGTADSDAGGLGIGLAVVKAVAQSHGGEATAVSSPDGTTFTLTLPLQPTPRP